MSSLLITSRPARRLARGAAGLPLPRTPQERLGFAVARPTSPRLPCRPGPRPWQAKLRGGLAAGRWVRGCLDCHVLWWHCNRLFSLFFRGLRHLSRCPDDLGDAPPMGTGTAAPHVRAKIGTAGHGGIQPFTLSQTGTFETRLPRFRRCGESFGTMAAAPQLDPNKLGPGYPAQWVWLGRGSGAGQKFAVRGALGLAGADRRGGSIGADEVAAAWALVGAGRSAKVKLPRPCAMAEFSRFVACSRNIASFATPRPSSAVIELGSAAVGTEGTPPFPLSDPARTPYPGRAGQTQPGAKSGRAHPCGFDCTGATAAGTRKISKPRMGSGVRAAQNCANSARESGLESGFGVAVGLAGHFRLDRGKAAKLGCGAS